MDSAGYQVTVIYAPLSPWADEFDEQLFLSTPAIRWIPAAPKPQKQPSKFLYTRARKKVFEKIVQHARFLQPDPTFAFVLYAQELKKQALREQADLFIGHNLGALPAITAAAKKWNVPCSFDAEDYHRGEAPPNTLHTQLAAAIENKYFGQLRHLTVASPLIGMAYHKLFLTLSIKTVNNVFSKTYLQPVKAPQNGKLRIFWFSQTLGPNRGLEVVIKALNLLPDACLELHLLGTCTALYKKSLLNLASKPEQIFFIPPVSLPEIFRLASQFDIGLASEVPLCENRDLCLTNKIFTYLLSSLCIVASDTQAQKQFCEQYFCQPLIYRYDCEKSLANVLQALYANTGFVAKCKEEAHDLAFTRLNWEEEQKQFLQIISETIPQN